MNTALPECFNNIWSLAPKESRFPGGAERTIRRHPVCRWSNFRFTRPPLPPPAWLAFFRGRGHIRVRGDRPALASTKLEMYSQDLDELKRKKEEKKIQNI